jgi:hypothetical protein
VKKARRKGMGVLVLPEPPKAQQIPPDFIEMRVVYHLDVICVWQVKNDEFGNQKVQSIAITLGNFAPSKLRGNYSSPYL